MPSKDCSHVFVLYVVLDSGLMSNNDMTSDDSVAKWQMILNADNIFDQQSIVILRTASAPPAKLTSPLLDYDL